MSLKKLKYYFSPDRCNFTLFSGTSNICCWFFIFYFCKIVINGVGENSMCSKSNMKGQNCGVGDFGTLPWSWIQSCPWSLCRLFLQEQKQNSIGLSVSHSAFPITGKGKYHKTLCPLINSFQRLVLHLTLQCKTTSSHSIVDKNGFFIATIIGLKSHLPLICHYCLVYWRDLKDWRVNVRVNQCFIHWRALTAHMMKVCFHKIVGFAILSIIL